MSRILTLVLLLAPIAAQAQSAAPALDHANTVVNLLSTPPGPNAVDTHATKTIQLLLPYSHACPVGLRAQRESGATTFNVARNGTPHSGHHSGIAQRLRISLQNAEPKPILSASITVHGYGSNPRIVETSVLGASSATSSELTRTLDLNFSGSSKRDLSADIVLDTFASANQIDLNSIRYADGSAWQPSGDQACHIAPDPLMLVAAR